ncbi:hypothetical protein C4573_05680 [Candidatus Woesearchaeota archaeon]|nr:MAG: hypothetical protein C4573_05680 [Candidatus Woesearchaeota archaeon]
MTLDGDVQVLSAFQAIQKQKSIEEAINYFRAQETVKSTMNAGHLPPGVYSTVYDAVQVVLAIGDSMKQPAEYVDIAKVVNKLLGFDAASIHESYQHPFQSQTFAPLVVGLLERYRNVSNHATEKSLNTYTEPAAKSDLFGEHPSKR